MTPEDRKYSDAHLWVKVESDATVVLGLTDHLQGQIGPIVFIDLPRVGTKIRRSSGLCEVESDPQSCGIPYRGSYGAQFDQLGEAESEQIITALASPVSGDVIELNALLEENPDLVNTDAYGDGWLARVRSSDSSELDSLLSAREYEVFVAQANGSGAQGAGDR